MAIRWVTAQVVVSARGISTATECHCCGFDALLAFDVHLISEAGVSPFATMTNCVRCYEEGHPHAQVGSG